MIAGFVIWTAVAGIFLAIGISSRRSEKPVGFFTFVKAPQVRDAGSYNRAVSRLWIIAAVVLEILGVPFLFLKQNSPVFVLLVFAVMALVIGMAAAYMRIEAKYRE